MFRCRSIKMFVVAAAKKHKCYKKQKHNNGKGGKRKDNLRPTTSDKFGF